MSGRLMKKLLHLLRYGAITQLWSWLSMIVVKVGGPKVAAYLSYLSIDWGGMQHKRTILCLYRESFVKDVVELRKYATLNYPMVTAGYTRFQMNWFPRHMQVQTFYKGHQHENERAITLGTEYANHLIRLVGKKTPVSAVLSANFDYWQDAGFKKACKGLDIPFLVLSREHPIIPRVCDKVIVRYRQSKYHFDGTAIAVAGRSTRDVILKAETICDPEQVRITGLPRYDAWRKVDISLKFCERPFITLLTFTRGYFADQTFREVLRLFCEAASRYSRSPVRFIIKTKDVIDTQYVRKIMDGCGYSDMQCDHELDLFDVLPQSRMVINYNSLSLLEAVMAKSLTVIPAWGECTDCGDGAMYSAENPKVAKVVSFAYAPGELLSKISDCVTGCSHAIKDDDARVFLGEYIHLSEQGSYCKEFEDFVSTYIGPVV